jgi:hypothetical protein
VISEVSKQSKVNILYNPNIFREHILISGKYNNLTITEALDTFLYQTSIGYKFFRKDIVLFRKNEIVSANHRITNPSDADETRQNKRIHDTITYSIITYDTLVTKLTRYQIVPVYDSITVYDTIDVIRKIDALKLVYQPQKKSFIAGLTLSQGKLFTQVDVNNIPDDTRKEIQAGISEKSSNGIFFSCIYRKAPWQIESGIALVRNSYSFEHSSFIKGFITRIDTIDRYYTGIVDGDTTWVYVTEEKQVETTSEKSIHSVASLYYISVPVLIGYSRTRRNLTFELKGGFMVNIYSGSKGYYLTTKTGNEITTNNTKLSAPSVTIDFFGAFGIDYFLDNHLHLLIQPYISYSTFGYKKQKTDYVFNNLQVGAQLGLGYFF